MVNEEISLEELLAQTEEKITNNNYYEDTTVHYKGKRVGVRIKPISQARFSHITKKNQGIVTLDFNTDIIHECVLNKHDNTQFTKEQINKLFTGGLASAIATKCCEISGIPTSQGELEDLKNF